MRIEKRIAVVATAVLVLCTHHSTAEAETSRDLNRGLVGHWTFDERKGAIARDVSGGDNHGTIKGGANWSEGKIGGALEFDGTDDFVSIPNEGDFDITVTYF